MKWSPRSTAFSRQIGIPSRLTDDLTGGQYLKFTIMRKIWIILCTGVLFLAGFQTKTDEREIKRFITDAADARMMDREEGRLASRMGTTADIRKYGDLMIKDQTAFLSDIQELAKQKKIALPEKITEEKARALQDLKDVKGTDFDKKFIRMIKIDHKRDIGEFKSASEYDDAQVSAFAKKYLPMIESHLSKVERIKDDVKSD